MKKFAVALAALACTTAVPALAAETLTATFTTPDGGVTVGTYSGIVNVTVSGTGFSNGSNINDAFYYDGGARDPNYYQLTFGTSPLVAYGPGQDAVNYVVGGLPAYQPSHIYTFLLNTGTAVPANLHFGVSDGVFGDNGGSYTITVSAVPEAATWGMMILGFGVVGGALRRRGAVAVSYAR